MNCGNAGKAYCVIVSKSELVWLHKEPKKHTKAQLLAIIEKLTGQKIGEGWVMLPKKDFLHLAEDCNCSQPL